MQHSHLINKETRDVNAWVNYLWVSGDDNDYQILKQTVSTLFQNAGNEAVDCFQPNGLDVAEILRQIDSDQPTLLAAILSDYYFIDSLQLEAIQQQYGDRIKILCENMRTLHRLRENTHNSNPVTSEKEQATQIRRMLLAMVKDVRVVLIKLAWHLQYLRLLVKETVTTQHIHAANQTMDIYAPLANWLGISHIKWELEDLAFRFLQPYTYRSIAKSLTTTRLRRENYIKEFIEILQEILEQTGIEAQISGRPKHIYSIWKKMKRKDVEIDQLYDLRAVRVIVKDKATCYEVISTIHEHWQHIPEEWDDYIANSKSNGYQSIHTVVVGPRSRHVEIQIRTKEMHELAELGVASHWRYKEGSKHDKALENVVSSMRRLLDKNTEDSELLEDFHTELFGDRVFVITPKGRVISLSNGATPIDFAYAIHTDVGHRCQGAKVNGKIVPLNYRLENGEQVEVMTGKEPRPRMHWLNDSLGYIKSARTRQKINHWFRQQNHEKNHQEGVALFEREKHLLNLPDLKAADLVKTFNRQNERDLFIALGRGDVSTRQLSETLIRSNTQEIHFRKVKKKTNYKGSDFIVAGVTDIYAQAAQCCQPVHGDPIIGYTTLGRGVSVHRVDCPNIKHLNEKQRPRLIEVSWGNSTTDYEVDITISGHNQPGMLRDIAEVLARWKINVIRLNARSTDDPQFAIMDITIQIEDTTQLLDILERIMQIPSVIDAQRRRM